MTDKELFLPTRKDWQDKDNVSRQAIEQRINTGTLIELDKGVYNGTQLMHEILHRQINEESRNKKRYRESKK